MRSYRNKDMIKYNAKVDRYFCFNNLIPCKQNNGVQFLVNFLKSYGPPFPKFGIRFNTVSNFGFEVNFISHGTAYNFIISSKQDARLAVSLCNLPFHHA